MASAEMLGFTGSAQPTALVCLNNLIAGNAVPIGGGKVLFAYDEQGQLIGEYNSNGDAIEETVYLGSQPVAVLKQSNVYYIHTDQLNTPRAISNSANTVVWRWDSDPFGTTAANDDPDLDGVKFTYNLRFAGQYYDQETGLNYNYFRDYDPGTGRYVESDLIGLGGGLNTYNYVFSNPINFLDRFGLKCYYLFRIPSLLLKKSPIEEYRLGYKWNAYNIQPGLSGTTPPKIVSPGVPIEPSMSINGRQTYFMGLVIRVQNQQLQSQDTSVYVCTSDDEEKKSICGKDTKIVYDLGVQKDVGDPMAKISFDFVNEPYSDYVDYTRNPNTR